MDLPYSLQEEHYPLGVGRGGTSPCEEHHQNAEKSYVTANASSVPAAMPAGPLHYNPPFRQRTLQSLGSLTDIGRKAIR